MIAPQEVISLCSQKEVTALDMLPCEKYKIAIDD
jgi:hypothetical protein